MDRFDRLTGQGWDEPGATWCRPAAWRPIARLTRYAAFAGVRLIRHLMEMLTPPGHEVRQR
ncbi:MAG: hypothetical protein U1E70_07625 [Acetobacteraceae bacterium]|nr:hypothetical protein [Pseudomonadota bacterium]